MLLAFPYTVDTMGPSADRAEERQQARNTRDSFISCAVLIGCGYAICTSPTLLYLSALNTLERPALNNPKMSDQERKLGSLNETLEELLKSKREQIETDALQLLRELIRIDTQNFAEEGTETEAVELIRAQFDEAGVTYKILEPKPGRGNIVARVAGDGTSGKGAVLLSAHLDTVHAPKEKWAEEGWKHDPYAAEINEDDGCVYGRGAIDMKHMAAQCVALLCFVQKNGIQLTRDLIFAGLSDEERSDSAYGVKYLVENHPELIEADLVLNEVGGFSFFINDKEAFPIQFAEKGTANLQLTVRGEGGHASVMNKDNPIAKVGAMAHKLTHTPLPVRANPINTTSINSIANVLPFPKSMCLRQLLSPRFTDLILHHLLTEDQANIFSPLLRNTATPTIIGGGDQPNQIPTMAWIMINARILPGCTIDDVIDDIKTVIGPDRFEVKHAPNGEETPPEVTLEVKASRDATSEDLNDPVCVEAMSVISNTIKKHANGAPVLPTMIPGSTDSHFYSKNPRRRPVCLGFTPIRFPPNIHFGKIFHGVNERVPVEGFKWGVHILSEVVLKLCDATLN